MDAQQGAEGFRAQELRVALGLGAFVFSCHLVQASAKVFQLAVFLPAYGRRAIPAAFLASSLAIPLASSGFAGLVRILSRRVLVTGSLLVFAGLLVLWRALAGILPHAAFAAYVLADVVSLLSVVVAWNVVNASLDPRQAKRLVPLVGLGSSLAFLVGGFGIRGLVHLGVRAQDLSLLAAASGLAAAVLYAGGRWELRSRRASPSSWSFWQGLRAGLDRVWRVPLLRVLLWATVSVTAAQQVLDFAFLARLQAVMGSGQLAAFLGAFVGILGVAQIVVQLTASSRVLFYLGGGATASVVPGLAAVGGLTFALWPSLWVVVGLRFLFRLFKTTFYSPAVQSLYSPVDREDKTQAMALLKGIVAPLVTAAVAALLLVAGPRLDDRVLGVALVLVALPGVVWLGWAAKRAYVAALNEALARNGLRLEHLGDEPFELSLDRAAVDRCLEILRSETSEHRGLFALELLSFAPAGLHRKVYAAALESPCVAVRVQVLESARQAKESVAADLARQALEDPEGIVAAEAIHVLLDLGPRGTQLLDLEGLVRDPRPVVRAVAALAKLKLSDGKVADGAGAPEALSVLDELLRSERSGDRADLSQALGLLPGTAGDKLLGELLRDSDLAVRRRALEAVAAGCRPGRSEEVLAALGEPRLALEAVRAAASLGETILPALRKVLADGAAPRDLLLRLPAVLATMGSDASLAVLEGLLDHEDDQVATRAARRLWRSGRRLSEDDLLSRVQAAVERACWYRGMRRGLARLGRPPALLAGEIRSLEVRAAGRAAATAALVLGGRLAERFWCSLESADRALRASAVELFENAAPRRLASLVIPLLEWRAAVGTSGRAGTTEAERRAASDPAWALVREKHRYVRLFFGYELPDLARKVGLPDLEEVERMATVLEKMLFLKGVSLFENLTGEELHRVAEIAREYRVLPGRTIFRKGDPGDAMYLVLDGQVRIVLDGSQVAVLGRGECFGEMALLDKEPRSADAVAVGEVELLRIEGADFDELLEQKAEIARGILKVLTDRLRRAIARPMDTSLPRSEAADAGGDVPLG